MKKGFALILAAVLIISCENSKSLTQIEKENLMQKLDSLVVQDQIAAGVPSDEDKRSKGVEKAWEDFTIIKDSIFKSNHKEVKSIYEKYGFLGFDKVGEQGAHDFWLLVQHFDFDVEFQEEILKKMKKEVRRKNANPNDYAYLQDRVNVNNGEKQIFGTQVEYKNDMRIYPKIGLIDSVNVDKRRAEYRLEPLIDELNSHMKMMYEMNKEFNPDFPEPNYYK